jgi:hypothetical protein
MRANVPREGISDRTTERGYPTLWRDVHPDPEYSVICVAPTAERRMTVIGLRSVTPTPEGSYFASIR